MAIKKHEILLPGVRLLTAEDAYNFLKRFMNSDKSPDWLYANDRVEYERQKQEMINKSKLKEKRWL